MCSARIVGFQWWTTKGFVKAGNTANMGGIYESERNTDYAGDLSDGFGDLFCNGYWMNPFEIRPKRWWDWVNPFFWRRKRIIEAVLQYEWEKAKPAIDNAVRDALIYGKGSFYYDSKR